MVDLSFRWKGSLSSLFHMSIIGPFVKNFFKSLVAQRCALSLTLGMSSCCDLSHDLTDPWHVIMLWLVSWFVMLFGLVNCRTWRWQVAQSCLGCFSAMGGPWVLSAAMPTKHGSWTTWWHGSNRNASYLSRRFQNHKWLISIQFLILSLISSKPGSSVSTFRFWCHLKIRPSSTSRRLTVWIPSQRQSQGQRRRRWVQVFEH